MSASNRSLREIVKTTSIYGGVQLVQLGGSLVKNKLIALWLGPHGIAISGYLNQLLVLLSQSLHFGLETIVIRKMSEGLGLSTRQVLRLRKWASYTALFSGLLTAVFCVPFSELTFGEAAFWPLILWLSLALIFKQLTAVEVAIFQGLRLYTRLARIQIASSLLALICSIPLYWHYQEKGIAIGILIGFAVPYLLLRSQSPKEFAKEDSANPLQAKNVFKEGSRIALTGLYTALALYAIQVGVHYLGGMQQAGYYQAAFGILFSYSGMLLAAMSSDYLPRLSQVQFQPEELTSQVNQQAYVGLIAHVVMSAALLLLAPEIIWLLFSRDFSPAIQALQWGAIGIFLRAASLSLGFVMLAKGDAKRYLRVGLLTNSSLVILVLGGFYFAGLQGAGIGFSIYYALHFILMQVLMRAAYQVFLTSSTLRFLIQGALLLFLILVLMLNWNEIATFGLRLALAVLVALYYLRQLRQQLRHYE